MKTWTHEKGEVRMKANKRLEALIAFAEGEAYCPCCEGVRKCERGCTYKKDVNGNSHYQRMVAARHALKVKEPI